GSGTGQGCGDVWSSPAVDPGSNTVVYGVGNCDHVAAARAAGLHWSEAMVAVRADTGRTLWRFQPAAQLPTRAEQDQEASADLDFGASPQIFTLADGHKVVGEGQKSAIYWVRDLRTGAPVWHTSAGSSGRRRCSATRRAAPCASSAAPPSPSRKQPTRWRRRCGRCAA